MTILKYFLASIFFISSILAFYSMLGYPILLTIVDKVKKPREHIKDEAYQPTVTLLIVAHNEEKVIEKKLENSISLDYPVEKLEIVVTSDNSTDKTNEIVNDYIQKHLKHNIRLYCTREHKGKTNAQNEACKTIKSEIIIMTDANPMLDKIAIKELVSAFSDDKIAYVCGKLIYSNGDDFLTSQAESTYWNYDLYMRDIESRLYSVTAGNGAIYACRKKDYYNFNPIECHDSAMPLFYVQRGKKALFNPKAIAFEKAGEVNEDEFKRKVRMNRTILSSISEGMKVINIFKYKWYSIFYFGHRTSRYLLWLCHLLAFACSMGLTCIGNTFGFITLVLQLLFFIISYIGYHRTFKNKFMRMIAFYGMTVFAQCVAVWKGLRKQNKSVWEKAESTR